MSEVRRQTPFQFSIGRILIATGWLAIACLGLTITWPVEDFPMQAVHDKAIVLVPIAGAVGAMFGRSLKYAGLALLAWLIVAGFRPAIH